ncbi:MAG: ABC transporter ATP-binding protein [Chitinophagaceae bacterium]
MERKKLFNFSELKRVFSYAAPYKRRFFISVILSIVLAGMAPVRPLLIQYTINNVIGKGLLNTLLWVTFFQVVLLFLETALRFYFSFITSWLGQTVVRDLRLKVYNKILRLNLSQFDKTPIGTLTTRTINDIESINDIFSEGLIPIIADMLSIIAILMAMFFTNWQLTLICLIPFPFLLLATYIFKESVNKSFVNVRNAVAALNAFVQEHISGMQIVQAFASEEKEMKKFMKINKDHRDANIQAIFAYSVFFPFVEIILAISLGLLVWFAGYQVLHMPREEAIQLAGQIISFFMLLNLLFRPLRVIADKFNVLQMGMVASERVFKVLDNEDYIQKQGDFAPVKIKGDLDFNKVWFAYEENKDVLKGIDFHLKHGETLAIVGHTGSGKSTIVSLVNRLYHIQQGEILLDGINIDDYQLDNLRGHISVVLQDVFLFSGSIFENVTLRNPAISHEQVVDIAKMIGIHEFIIQLPGGYDYNVMERGATLSLGQRQLISFMRALLNDPSVLILDEATSSIDSHSEMLIQHAIEKMISGRTSIIVAHRLSTIRKAQKIMVLDGGEIREMGTHEELLAKGGLYADLCRMQFAEGA